MSLTEEEMSIIQQHPLRGCHLLSSISQLGASLEGIRHHHERFDGSGYPDGLRGEEIPITARIIAVADIFDALTSSRAYRQALPPSEVRAYIRAAAGRQLDPRIVEAFDSVFPDLLEEASLPRILSPSGARPQESTSVCTESDDRNGHLSHTSLAAD
jgi:HD-GYP domain-containing protein (c-di-GMP phosphodiesterase class II)